RRSTARPGRRRFPSISLGRLRSPAPAWTSPCPWFPRRAMVGRGLRRCCSWANPR
ncbi:MAG: hypothetical protein, partial [Olavius algarvensis Gamma 1 endosymbiont]